ncbi:MAG: histone deacetylase [Gemmatimonadota bacterium]|jgi:acetoin utilization deacetylase AcuC-like enzyme
MDSGPKPTALVSHPDCALHDTGWRHPEHQGRLPGVVRALARDTPALLEHVLQEEAPHATEADLLRVHTAAHVDRVRSAVEAATRDRPVALDADTIVSPASWDAALAAAGAVLRAVELVLNGRAATGFALSRPPGHHATADRAMGFCLFNNVAVAVRGALERPDVDRVLIVDWDVHHGNGTQDIFYADPSVHYVSLHLSPHYPGTGAAAERGIGAGDGATHNVPLSRATTREQYLDTFRTTLSEAFEVARPDLVLVSAGFDCMAGDPLGGLPLEPVDLHTMAAEVVAQARATAAGRVVAALEGGYVPDRVGAGVVDVVRALAGLPSKD